eukprot:1177085-Ditylum_brightwellii.AAC.1
MSSPSCPGHLGSSSSPGATVEPDNDAAAAGGCIPPEVALAPKPNGCNSSLPLPLMLDFPA